MVENNITRRLSRIDHRDLNLWVVTADMESEALNTRPLSYNGEDGEEWCHVFGVLFIAHRAFSVYSHFTVPIAAVCSWMFDNDIQINNLIKTINRHVKFVLVAPRSGDWNKYLGGTGNIIAAAPLIMYRLVDWCVPPYWSVVSSFSRLNKDEWSRLMSSPWGRTMAASKRRWKRRRTRSLSLRWTTRICWLLFYINRFTGMNVVE